MHTLPKSRIVFFVLLIIFVSSNGNTQDFDLYSLTSNSDENIILVAQADDNIAPEISTEENLDLEMPTEEQLPVYIDGETGEEYYSPTNDPTTEE